MRNILFFFILAALGNFARADWSPAVTGTSLTAYIDPGSMQKSVDAATMRVLIDYKKQPFDGNNLPYLSTLLLVEYDCKGARFRALETTSFAGHMASGHRPYISHEPGEWKTTKPNTIQHTLQHVACGLPTEQKPQQEQKKEKSKAKKH